MLFFVSSIFTNRTVPNSAKPGLNGGLYAKGPLVSHTFVSGLQGLSLAIIFYSEHRLKRRKITVHTKDSKAAHGDFASPCNINHFDSIENGRTEIFKIIVAIVLPVTLDLLSPTVRLFSFCRCCCFFFLYSIHF